MSADVEPYSHRTHLKTERHGSDAKQRRAEIQGRVDAWNAANPEVATPFGRENLARAIVMPSVARLHSDPESFEQMWVDRFTADPDLMWLIIGDIVRYVSSDETERGDRASGRRKVRAEDHNLDAVWRIIGPQFSMEPFPVALKELVGSRSLRQFSVRAGFKSSATLGRYLRAERALTMEVLEACAKAGRVEPFYFLEFRAMWVSRELFRALMARPNDSVRAVRKIRDSVV